MLVVKTEKKPEAIPDYYSLYLGWSDRASKTGSNYDIDTSLRFARLAEEFGLAVILDDETWDGE